MLQLFPHTVPWLSVQAAFSSPPAEYLAEPEGAEVSLKSFLFPFSQRISEP